MAPETLAAGTAPAILRRPQRIFLCNYLCDACENEWDDTLLTAGISWCPCCDREAEPYLVDEYEEERPEWEE